MSRDIIRPDLIVNEAYRTVTRLGHFDVNEGNKPIDMNDNISDIPNKMFGHLCNGGKGCCFVFAASMMNILEENGIENYMVLTPEGNGKRGSVLYIINGRVYVANPVEDIEYFTENNIGVNERGNYYKGRTADFIKDGKRDHNDAYFTLEDFSLKYGPVSVLPDFNQDMSLAEAMAMAEVIAVDGQVLISPHKLKVRK